MSNCIKRNVMSSFDSEPSIGHKMSYKISKKYIDRNKVLDIGCWTGQFEALAHKTAKEIIGIDPDQKAIEFAKKNNKDKKNIKFKVGNVLKLPFKDNAFDTILFLEVIEHLPINSETVALKEIKRVLKDKGTLILSTPNNNIFSILLDPAYFIIGHRHYSLKLLDKTLKDLNFQILKHKYVGGITKLLISNINLVAKHTIRKNINWSQYINKKIEKEYLHGGFSNIFLIAKKN